MSDLNQVEMSIDAAQALIKKKESFDRLIQNKDFQFLIEEEYFIQEPARIASARADPSMQNEATQKQLLSRLDAIGYLKQYLICTNVEGSQARVDMAAAQETRQELLNEDLD